MSIQSLMVFLKISLAVISLFNMSAFAFAETGEKIEAKFFVYTEVQNSVPFKEHPWKKLNPIISSQPGFLYKTWFSGLGNNSIGGFYGFNSLENAQKYVTEFFPNGARKQDKGHTTRIFDATVVKEASQDIGSVDYGGIIQQKPKAFVYTEIQVNMPFKKAPWRKRNPSLKMQKGLLSKTWLSGVNTNTLGGIYAFDSIENAKKFAFEDFPASVKHMKSSLYIRVFDGDIVEEASRGMNSPYFN